MGTLIDGAAIARRIEGEVARECERLVRLGVTPSLVAVQVGHDAASALYIKRQRRACARLGVGYRVKEVPADVSEQALLREIALLNRSPQVTGIILQMPLPPHLNPRTLRRALRPDKDVEGVHPQNLGYLLSGRPVLVPCTAAAVMECVLAAGRSLEGLETVVVGHSEIVGKPAALLLMERLATVTVCHVGTRDLWFHTERAELLVVAVGKPHLIPGNRIREGAIVVDVGINESIVDGEPVVVGDVETEAALERASFITPVPGGVGPVTVATLLRNTVKAAASQGPLAI